MESNHIPTDIWLFFVIGIPTWTLVDGTWSALSQIASVAPESYEISSYLMLSLTMGNIVPLIGSYFLKNYSRKIVCTEILVILFVGLCSGLLLSFFWKYTVLVDGQYSSLPLFILLFTIGSCSSLSNVTHYILVSQYASICTTAMSTGMAFGSMLAGVLAIVQGTVMFISVSNYFLILSFLYIPAICALYFVRRHDRSSSGFDSLLSSEPDDFRESITSINDKQQIRRRSIESTESSAAASSWNLLLGFQCLNATLGYGMVPALISFACGKFQNRQDVLLLATTTSCIIDPICRMLTGYIRITTVQGFASASSLLVLLGIVIITVAALPPSAHIFQQSLDGTALVCVYVCFNGLFGYTNTCMFRYSKLCHQGADITSGYKWTGIATQSGAFFGSLLAFCLVISGVFL